MGPVTANNRRPAIGAVLKVSLVALPPTLLSLLSFIRSQCSACFFSFLFKILFILFFFFYFKIFASPEILLAVGGIKPRASDMQGSALTDLHSQHPLCSPILKSTFSGQNDLLRPNIVHPVQRAKSVCNKSKWSLWKSS